MRELLADQPIFIGFKLDTNLKRQLQAIAGPDRKYVSEDDSTFLLICRVGEDQYVGKLIRERLTTDRIEDIRRNIFSIMQRLCPETRLPASLVVLAAGRLDGETGPQEPVNEKAW